jgi:hypothetical protein
MRRCFPIAQTCAIGFVQDRAKERWGRMSGRLMISLLRHESYVRDIMGRSRR